MEVVFRLPKRLPGWVAEYLAQSNDLHTLCHDSQSDKHLPGCRLLGTARPDDLALNLHWRSRNVQESEAGLRKSWEGAAEMYRRSLCEFLKLVFQTQQLLFAYKRLEPMRVDRSAHDTDWRALAVFVALFEDTGIADLTVAQTLHIDAGLDGMYRTGTTGALDAADVLDTAAHTLHLHILGNLEGSDFAIRVAGLVYQMGTVLDSMHTDGIFDTLDAIDALEAAARSVDSGKQWALTQEGTLG